MAKTPAKTSSSATKRSPMEKLVAMAERLGYYREQFGYQKAKAEGLELQIDLNNRVAALESAAKQIPPSTQPNSQEGHMAQNDNNPTASRDWSNIARNTILWSKRAAILAIILVVGYGAYGGYTMIRDWKSPAQKNTAQTETPSTLTTSDVEKIAKNIVKAEVASFEDRFNTKLDTKFDELKKAMAPAPKSEAATKPSMPPAFSLSKWSEYNGSERLGVMYIECKDENWGSRNEKDVKAKLANMSRSEIEPILKSCNEADLFKSNSPISSDTRAQAPARSATVASAPAANDDQVPEAGDDDAKVQQVGFYPGRQNFGSMRRGGGTPNCPPSFRYDPRERSCIRHTEVSGPSPYDVPANVARCVPGSRRTIEVRSPTGGRRVVEQVCNVHH